MIFRGGAFYLLAVMGTSVVAGCRKDMSSQSTLPGTQPLVNSPEVILEPRIQQEELWSYIPEKYRELNPTVWHFQLGKCDGTHTGVTICSFQGDYGYEEIPSQNFKNRPHPRWIWIGPIAPSGDIMLSGWYQQIWIDASTGEWGELGGAWY